MVTNDIEKYNNHPGIKAIKASLSQTDRFEFSHVSPRDVMQQIEAIDPSKSNSGNIPMKILQNSKDIVIPYFTDSINAAINNCNFPNDLKVADVSAGYKRGIKTDRSNYRPISVLPPISKIFNG